jgi:hypothetical protein
MAGFWHPSRQENVIAQAICAQSDPHGTDGTISL